MSGCLRNSRLCRGLPTAASRAIWDFGTIDLVDSGSAVAVHPAFRTYVGRFCGHQPTQIHSSGGASSGRHLASQAPLTIVRRTEDTKSPTSVLNQSQSRKKLGQTYRKEDQNGQDDTLGLSQVTDKGQAVVLALSRRHEALEPGCGFPNKLLAELETVVHRDEDH